MQLSDLSPEIIDKIKSCRYDCIIEKHEGPERWSSVLEYYGPEFMQIDGYDVLLPVSQSRHRNITILRCIVSKDEQTLTIFLKDMTHVRDPEDEFFFAGFVAICEKVPDEEFYLAVFYHNWFIVENW